MGKRREKGRSGPGSGRQRSSPPVPGASREPSPHSPIDQDVEAAQQQFRQYLGDGPDVVIRRLVTGKERALPALVVYVDSLCNSDLIAESIVEKLLEDYPLPITRTNALTVMEQRLIATGSVRRVNTYAEALGMILNGCAVVIPHGAGGGLACEVTQFSARAIEEPDTESVAKGPREGFNESLRDNLSLIRRKLRTHHLRLEAFVMGRYTRTNVVLAYLEGVCPPPIVEEARSRLSRIGENIDGVLLTETVVELIEDHPASLFPTISSTERPDRVAAALLEGRFAILVEGTPFVMTAPTLFAEFMTSGEDYAERPLLGSFIRLLRHFSLYGAIFTPALYVALVSYHQETIPALLLMSIVSGREAVPFPAVVEALLMETAFEILREAGLRLPRPIGGAISIVGVLVVGQAAVAAGIVSPMMIIVVGTTAIASFTVPNFPAANVLRFLRFPILLLTGAFGAMGIIVSFILLSLHMMSLRSFGIPFLSPLGPFNLADNMDVVLRQPVWAIPERPGVVGFWNRRRIRPGLMPHAWGRGNDDGTG